MICDQYKRDPLNCDGCVPVSYIQCERPSPLVLTEKVEEDYEDYDSHPNSVNC